MPPTYIVDWGSELVALAQKHSIVFVPLGQGFDSIRSSCLSFVSRIVSVEQYLREPLDSTSPGLVAIIDLETICQPSSLTIGQLRARVHEDYEKYGTKFILFSRFSRHRFPDVPGSSLIFDAKLYFPPLEVSGDGDQKRFMVPDFEGSEKPSREQVGSLLIDVGADVVASLDFWIYESMLGRDDLLVGLDQPAIECLRSVGLLRISDSSLHWTYPNAFFSFKLALSDAIALFREPPNGTSEAFRLVWIMERSIRRAMRARAVAESNRDSWRGPALTPELIAEVLGRATVEAYPAANTINEIRDPLEWLSLGELLDLRVRNKTLYGDLGVSPAVWSSFTKEVPPIRNRLSHMRLLQRPDLDKLRKWATALDRKLESQGV